MSYNKDSKWFGDKIEKLKQSMYLLALTILKNDADAEDAMQNAVLKAYENLDKLRITEKFKPWIFKILINECYKILNTRKYNDDINEFTDIKEQDRRIEDKMTVWEAVNKLETGYREVTILFYYDCMKIKDIAKTLGISEANVKKRLQRARLQLGNLLDKEDFR